LGQHDHDWIHFITEFSSSVGLRDLCEQIRESIGDRIVFITGDRSGHSKSELIEGNRTAYDIICQELDIGVYQNEAPNSNPTHMKSRLQVNSMFERFPELIIDKRCKQLILDLKFVEADDKHGLVKDRNKAEGKADFLDCFRYYLNTWFDKQITL